MPQEPVVQEPQPKQFVRLSSPQVNEPAVPAGPAPAEGGTPWFSLDDFSLGNLTGRAVEGDVRAIRGLGNDDDLGELAYGEPQSVAGKLTQGIIDMVPLIAAERMAVRFGLDAFKVSAEARKASKLLKFGEVAGGGSLAGFVLGKQGAGLSNTLAQLPPGMAQEIGSILASNPDDSELERRLKAVVEGSIVGVGAHALLGVFVKGVKAVHYQTIGKHAEAARARFEAGEAAAKLQVEQDAALARQVSGAQDKSITTETPSPEATKAPGTQGTEGKRGTPELAIKGTTEAQDFAKVFGKDTAEDLLKTVEARQVDPALNFLLEHGDQGPGDARIANEKGGLTPYAMTAEERMITASRKGDTNTMRVRGPRGAVETANAMNRYADKIHDNSVVETVSEQELRTIAIAAESAGVKLPHKYTEALAEYATKIRDKPELAKGIAEFSSWAKMYRNEGDEAAEDFFKLADRGFKNQADKTIEAEFLDRLGYQAQHTAISRSAYAEFARALSFGGKKATGILRSALSRKTTAQALGAIDASKPSGLIDSVVKRATTQDSVPFSTIVLDTAAYDKALEALPGGKAGVTAMMEKYSKFANTPKPEGAASKIVAEGLKPKGPRAWDFFYEAYLNFILSGPRTVSNVLQQEFVQGLYYQPIRSAIGGRINEVASAIAGNLKRAAEHGEAARIAARRVTADAMFNPRVMERTPKMLKLVFGSEANPALKAGPSEIAEFWRNGPKIAYEPIAQYIKSKGWNPDSPFARFVYWAATEKGLNLGAAIRTPSRALSAIDASIRAEVHGGGVWSELTERAAKQFPTNPTAQSDYVFREFDKMFSGGKLRTELDVKNEVVNDVADIAKVTNISKAKQAELIDSMFAEKMKTEKPMLDMAQYYEREGNEAAATNKPTSKWGKQAMALMQHPVAKFFEPFPRAAYSIFSSALRPLNPLSYWEIAKNFRVPVEARNLEEIHGKLAKDFLSGEPRRMADATGRMATAAIIGGTIVYFGSKEAPDGLPYITGAGPKSVEARKNLQQIGGWLPDSIYVPGYGRIQWRRADPVATMAAAYATYANFSRFSTKEDAGVAGNVLSALHLAGTEAMKNASFVQGMTDLGELLQGGMDPMVWLKKQVGNVVVPNLVTQLTPTVENMADMEAYSREVETLQDAWLAKLPFNDLAPKRNILGEPLKAQNYIGLDVLSPYAANQTEDPVVQREFNKAGLTMDKPGKVREGVDLSTIPAGNTNAWNRFQELVGEKNASGMTLRDNLRKMFNAKWYKNLPQNIPKGVDDPRADFIRREIEDRRSLAWYKLLRENPGVRDALRQANLKQASIYKR